MATVREDLELRLSTTLGELAEWPLECVEFLYPWGQPGPLANFSGPSDWQRGFLNEWGQEIRARGFDGSNPVPPIQMSTVSGHGIGKSALTAMIVDVILSTRPFCKGIVTANTFSQLETKTWAEIAKWTKMMVCAHWFKVNTGRGAMRVTHKDYPEQWRVDGIAWRENAPEAFAGLHAANSTPFYIFDEASGISEKIFEVARGGLTDGEPMEFLFGNGTKNSGYFYKTHTNIRDPEGKLRYICRTIDSRTVEITNKAYLKTLQEDYGEENDVFKVRVRGMFPSQSSRQLISQELVDGALRNEVASSMFDAYVWGIDVARYGSNKSVLVRRRGRDATTEWKKWTKISSSQLAANIAHEWRQERQKPDAIFIDGSGIGGPVADILRDFYNIDCIEVNFGSKSPNTDFFNMGAYCWGEMAKWLSGGAIPPDKALCEQLVAREYWLVGKGSIQLDSKEDMEKDGKPSPDEADALALTFAMPTVSQNLEDEDDIRKKKRGEYEDDDNGSNYNPFEREYGAKACLCLNRPRWKRRPEWTTRLSLPHARRQLSVRLRKVGIRQWLPGEQRRLSRQ